MMRNKNFIICAALMAASVNGIQLPRMINGIADEGGVTGKEVIENQAHLRGLLSVDQGVEVGETAPGDANGNGDLVDDDFGTVHDDYLSSTALDTDDKCDAGSTKICIDFSTTPTGEELQHGEYIRNEWLGAYGMSINVEAREGSDRYAPDGMARIYDSSVTSGNDPDLGSPNEHCSPPGPGRGEGGRPGARGENCESQGNIVIVQQEGKEPADDSIYGGKIIFSFECALEQLLSLGLIDIQNKKSSITVNMATDSITRMIDGLGDNSVQSEQFYDVRDVNRVTLELAYTGGISYICFCLDVDKCHQQGLKEKTPLPAPQSTKVITWSMKNNWNEDGTFNEGKGSRFFPPEGTELLSFLPGAPRNVPSKYPFAVNEADFLTLTRSAIASWQSIADFHMQQVKSGGDIVLESVANAQTHTAGSVTAGASAYAFGKLSYGGGIVFCLYRRTSNYGEEEYKDWTSSNQVYATALHEFGHVVGLGHTFTDTREPSASPNYVPYPIFNTAAMDYRFEVDGAVKQYLNYLDISEAQRRWNPSKYQPLISLLIHTPQVKYYVPSPMKHYYTNSFDEANILVKSKHATDVLWIYGVLSKTDSPDRRPLYRSYSGALGHRYSLETPIEPICRQPFGPGSKSCFLFYDEGPIGYLWRNPAKNLSPLYRFSNSDDFDDEILSNEAEEPLYGNRTLLGYFIGFNAMVGFANEQVDFD